MYCTNGQMPGPVGVSCDKMETNGMGCLNYRMYHAMGWTGGNRAFVFNNQCPNIFHAHRKETSPPPQPIFVFLKHNTQDTAKIPWKILLLLKYIPAWASSLRFDALAEGGMLVHFYRAWHILLVIFFQLHSTTGGWGRVEPRGVHNIAGLGCIKIGYR